MGRPLTKKSKKKVEKHDETQNSSNSSKGDSGNTQESPALWWVFTLNNYSEDDIKQIQALPGRYVFQEEIAPVTGTPHLQGTIKWNTKKRFSACKKLFLMDHWDKCKNIQESIKYCSDEDKRAPGGRLFKTLKVPDKLQTITKLNEWQSKLLQRLGEEPNPRTIMWYWEDQGNVGKTSFAKWLAVYHDAFYLCGSAADMKFGLAAISQKNYGWFPKIIILDIPRESEGCSYKGLEQIKNGIFYSTKFESGMVVFNTPHVVVFSNSPPKEWKMSADRWDIVEIAPAAVSGGVGDTPKD